MFSYRTFHFITIINSNRKNMLQSIKRFWEELYKIMQNLVKNDALY